MDAWLWAVLAVFGGLFAVKLAYVLSTAGVLGITAGALYVSTSQPRIQAFLETVPLTPDQTLYDLGCGDGRVLRAVRKKWGARAVGYEINPLAFALAKVRCALRPGITVKWGDFYRADLEEADVVFCYLFPDALIKLSAKLEREIRPETLVVSCNFPLPGRKADRIVRPGPQRHSDPIYLYQGPGPGQGRRHRAAFGA